MDNAKWQHDRYDARSQAPKSHDEIVATYGFDIRIVHDAGSLDAGRPARKSRYFPLFTLPYLTFGVGRLLHLPSAEAVSVRPNAQPRCNQRSQ